MTNPVHPEHGDTGIPDENSPVKQLTAAEEATDVLVAKWLDGEQADEIPAGALQHRLADQLFIHGLLSQHFREGRAGTMARVDRALSRLAIAGELPPPVAAPVLTPARKRGRRAWIVSLATTTAAALAVVTLLSVGRPPSVEAAVEHALRQSETSVDREYRLEAVIQRPGETEREIKSTLFVRGREKFALRHPALVARGELWLGSNGRDLWIVPAVGPVLVDEDSKLLERWIGERNISTPFLQINTILARLRDRYRLERVVADSASQSPSVKSSPRQTRIRGTLKVADGRLPQQVELWADPQSGVAERLVLTWSPETRASGLQRLTFDLAKTEPVDDVVYEHATHHDPRRPVLSRH